MAVLPAAPFPPTNTTNTALNERGRVCKGSDFLPKRSSVCLCRRSAAERSAPCYRCWQSARFVAAGRSRSFQSRCGHKLHAAAPCAAVQGRRVSRFSRSTISPPKSSIQVDQRAARSRIICSPLHHPPSTSEQLLCQILICITCLLHWHPPACLSVPLPGVRPRGVGLRSKLTCLGLGTGCLSSLLLRL